MDVPPVVTYASVVSRETVRIALTMASLKAFGKDKGHKAIVVRALYSLKSAGMALRSHLADCMRQI